MKAFTTACALIAGSASADSQFYNNGFIHHPIQTAYHPAVYGVHPQTTPLTYMPQAAALGGYYLNHPAMAVHPTLIKREAEAEPEFSYQSKVTHPEEKSAYEFQVNVDQMGNGRSYQHHQQMDSRMNQRNQMDSPMNQYNMDRHMSQMDQYMDSPRSRMNQMDMHRRNQMDSRMNQIDGHRMQYNMEQNRMNQINEMSREGDMFDRMMEQRQDSNMRDFIVRRQQEGRNNMYSYERMLQRQNEA